MCVNKAIINRQWDNRNHDVFGSIARRQIRAAIRRLRNDDPDQVFSSKKEVADRIDMMVNRDDVAAVIVKEGELSFRVMIRAYLGFVIFHALISFRFVILLIINSISAVCNNKFLIFYYTDFIGYFIHSFGVSENAVDLEAPHIYICICHCLHQLSP